eukprot:CAMPEP_0180826074 /NCGR_PEP_ID=MMETSP1038_2-20121128/73334_1 /TAXON_ID=632150 /ORGANISM="Azadinium spinosum, Strain 3D9" /LENGTH=30 /DNA_ID= /DNA_START= /DNA_END= /DNA_ORIENTATION=
MKDAKGKLMVALKPSANMIAHAVRMACRIS